MKTAVVVDDDPIIRMDLADILKKAGFTILGLGKDGFDGVELCANQRPDLALLDIKMPVFDGLAAAASILERELAGCVVLLTAFNDPEFIEKAKTLGVAGYLVKPVDERNLLATVEIALAQTRSLRQARVESRRILRKLEDQSLIDRAKAILAKKDGIAESEAYARIQRMSMDKSVGMAEVARLLVSATSERDVVDRAKAALMRRHDIGESAAYRRVQRRSRERGCDIAAAAREILDECGG